MSIILFKSMDTAYLNLPTGVAVENTGIDTISASLILDDKDLIMRNCSKILAIIDTDHDVIYDVYQSEIASYRRTNNSYQVKINATIFRRLRFTSVIDKVFSSGESLTLEQITTLQYMYPIMDKSNDGQGKALLQMMGETNHGYRVVDKSEGNSVGKLYHDFGKIADGFRFCQYPAGRSMSNVYQSDADDRMIPFFVGMDNAKKGITFLQDTHAILVLKK